MNVFFDVDDTIISAWEGTLRPLVKDVFEQVNRDGHLIFVWSGVGLRWREIDAHGLRPYVRDCYLKPLTDYRRSLPLLGIHVEPHFVVDDCREVVDAFNGYTVKPYVWRDPADRVMAMVYEEICRTTKALARARTDRDGITPP